MVRADPNLQIILRPTNTTGYVAFNFKVKEFQDKRVRQAIAHAINKKGIVDALYGGTGHGGDAVPAAAALGVQQGAEGLRLQSRSGHATS